MGLSCFVSVCAILFVSGAHEFRETAGTYVEVMVLMKECVFRYISMAVSVRGVFGHDDRRILGKFELYKFSKL